jgi:hypothetical protein
MTEFVSGGPPPPRSARRPLQQVEGWTELPPPLGGGGVARSAAGEDRPQETYFIVGMTKLAFSRTPPFGQRAVTVFTRV